ncbi:hypothetical protein [Streptomyces zaomyceticus]|uniref:hypothetical protein n=1 Tax=Streptomyces zaomyceticus TaxID=68286 RepID=UPI0036811459
MVATQPAPVASAANGDTGTKPVLTNKMVRLMVCDKGTYQTRSSVWQVHPVTGYWMAPHYFTSGEKCGKFTLTRNEEYTVVVSVWNAQKNKRGKRVKTFTFTADRPMTVATLGTAEKPRLERYRK